METVKVKILGTKWWYNVSYTPEESVETVEDFEKMVEENGATMLVPSEGQTSFETFVVDDDFKVLDGNTGKALDLSEWELIEETEDGYKLHFPENFPEKYKANLEKWLKKGVDLSPAFDLAIDPDEMKLNCLLVDALCSSIVGNGIELTDVDAKDFDPKKLQLLPMDSLTELEGFDELDQVFGNGVVYDGKWYDKWYVDGELEDMEDEARERSYKWISGEDGFHSYEIRS